MPKGPKNQQHFSQTNSQLAVTVAAAAAA